MKILYGVQATGNGHITRARALAPNLHNAGIHVDFLFSGRDREKFFDMDIFGDWQCKRGLTFIHEAGKLSVTKTLTHNNIVELMRDINSLDLSDYDLVLTDFEPITAWAARRQKKTCIGVGHQYAFSHPVPRRGDTALSRMIMRHFAPATMELGLHWHHFGHPILPPIAEVHEDDTPTDHNKIIVYLGFEAHDEIIQLLEPFKSPLFVVYGPYSRYQSFDNIQLKPLSREGFQKDLASAGGVICNAGFELASEAIQLGKKLLVKPLQGQMEQLSNAKALEQLKLAMTMDTLDRRILKQWLDNFSSERVVYPNVAKAIVDWLQSDRRDIEGLSNQLWQNVTMPHEPTMAVTAKAAAKPAMV